MEKIIEFIILPESIMVAGLLFVIISIFPLRKAIANLRRALQSKHWPKVQGTITRSQIKELYTQDGKVYGIDFEYSYEVEGQQYSSEGRYLDEEYGRSWIGDFQEFVDEHPAGDPVEVYYYPKDPKVSAIIVGTKPRYYIMIALSLVFTLAGAALISLGNYMR
jgi:hypothetical protein